MNEYLSTQYNKGFFIYEIAKEEEKCITSDS